jgi:chromosome partitioning protein
MFNSITFFDVCIVCLTPYKRLDITPYQRQAMPVLSLLNQKGGVGKTTLAIHIATFLAQKGWRVFFIDADRQGSAMDWSAARKGDVLFPVVGLPKDTLHREIAALSAPYDWVVIDGPPRVYPVAKSAIAASDIVMIPVQPSPYDVWAAREIVDLIAEAQIMKDNLKAVFAVNRKIVGTAIGRDVTEALAGYAVPVLQACISQRVGFAETAASGQTVLETDPKGPAAQEIRALVTEITELMEYVA